MENTREMAINGAMDALKAMVRDAVAVVVDSVIAQNGFCMESNPDRTVTVDGEKYVKVSDIPYFLNADTDALVQAMNVCGLIRKDDYADANGFITEDEIDAYIEANIDDIMDEYDLIHAGDATDYVIDNCMDDFKWDNDLIDTDDAMEFVADNYMDEFCEEYELFGTDDVYDYIDEHIDKIARNHGLIDSDAAEDTIAFDDNRFERFCNDYDLINKDTALGDIKATVAKNIEEYDELIRENGYIHVSKIADAISAKSSVIASAIIA